MPNPKVIIKEIETEQEKYISQIMEKVIFGNSEIISSMITNENFIQVIAITSYDEAIGVGSIFFEKDKKQVFKIGIVKGFKNLGYEELIEQSLVEIIEKKKTSGT
jgi:hypothetical protein